MCIVYSVPINNYTLLEVFRDYKEKNELRIRFSDKTSPFFYTLQIYMWRWKLLILDRNTTTTSEIDQNPLLNSITNWIKNPVYGLRIQDFN